LLQFWVGLVQLGLGRGPIERNLGTWALRRAQSFRKAKPKMRFFAKGPRQPSPVNEPRSAPTSETPVTSMKVMPEVPPTVGLGLGDVGDDDRGFDGGLSNGWSGLGDLGESPCWV
jgi:hypothetical protein